MDIKVIRSKDVMAAEDLLNIKGGLNESLDFVETECECDCFIGNSNTKPATPSKPIKGTTTTTTTTTVKK